MPEPVRNQFRVMHRLRVRWAEVDLQRIVFNPHYLMYIDTALTEYWRVMALPYASIPPAFGGELYVRKSTLEYLGSARLDDLLDVGTRCARIGNSSMVFEAAIFRNDRLLVSAELVYVFADAATQTARRVPDLLREMFQSFEAGVAPITTHVGNWTELGAQTSALRREVFIDALGLDITLAEDDADAVAMHTVLRNRMGLSVATARLLQDGPQSSRIARVAVTASLRGTGFGRRLVESVLLQAAQRGDTRVVVRTQCAVQGFYAQLGFTATGAAFDEEGVAHIDMQRSVQPI